MSSHHCIVTRSPNHWCAISCARIEAIVLRVFTDAACASASRSVSRKKIAPVFSIAPAAKSGTATRSSLPNGYLMRSTRSCRTSGSAAPTSSARCGELALVRRRADADRDAVGAALDALEVADGHRDEVRRHLRRSSRTSACAVDCWPARAYRTRTVPFEIAVSPRSTVSVMPNVALNAGSSKHGKRAAGVGRLELRHRVFAELRLADVEAAQL